uniref:T-box domain-containing protein n=1 Tax=Caenorhabditis japonica TaxID=281687 RepID=A0A8R1IZM7_CAEJA
MQNSLNLFLSNNDQWETLKNRGLLAEMMLAKSGQLLTPALQYGVVGLDENALYRVSIEIQRIDDKIYDFGQIDGKWVWWHKSNATTVETAQVVQHKDGPQRGSYWIKHGFDFSWLKLTNKQKFVTDRHAFVEPRQQYRPIVRIEDVSNLDIQFIYSNQYQVFITVTAFVSEQFLELKDMWIKSRKKAGGPKKRSNEGEGGTVGKKQKKEKLSKGKATKSERVQTSFDDDCDADLDEMLLNAMDDRNQNEKFAEPIPSTSAAPESSTSLISLNEEKEDLFTEFFVVPPSSQNFPRPDLNYQFETIAPEKTNQFDVIPLEDPNNWSNESLEAIFMAYQAQEQNLLLFGCQTVPEPYGTVPIGKECYGQVQVTPEVIQPIPVQRIYDQGYNSDQSFPEDFHVYPPEQYQNNHWSNVKKYNSEFSSPH